MSYVALHDDQPCPMCGSVVAILLMLVPWVRDTPVRWERKVLEEDCRALATRWGLEFPTVCQIIRACVAHSLTSPPVFEVIEILGRAETLARIRAVAEIRHPWLAPLPRDLNG